VGGARHIELTASIEKKLSKEHKVNWSKSTVTQEIAIICVYSDVSLEEDNNYDDNNGFVMGPVFSLPASEDIQAGITVVMPPVQAAETVADVLIDSSNKMKSTQNNAALKAPTVMFSLQAPATMLESQSIHEVEQLRAPAKL
jgi:hypothetical protein